MVTDLPLIVADAVLIRRPDPVAGAVGVELVQYRPQLLPLLALVVGV
jgi:hypothetical protein